MNREKRNVVYITDETYIVPTYVSVCSVLDSRDAAEDYHIFVLCHQVSEKSKRMLAEIFSANVEIEIIDIQPEFVEAACKMNEYSPKSTGFGAPWIALLKFDIPDMLPKLDKALYLDGDILVQKSLEPVFETEIDEVYLAAVSEMTGLNPAEDKFRFGELGLKDYFNSGLMWMNLKKMRNDCLCDKLKKYRREEKNHLMDQDAFNVVTQNTHLNLPMKYNYLAEYEHKNLKKLEEVYEVGECGLFSSFLDNLPLLHMICKPWKTYHPFYTVRFEKYYNLRLKSVIPFELFGEDSRIVLYAAGNRGNWCYDVIQKTGYGKIVLWVDSYHQKKGQAVKSPAEILKCTFDYILIAVDKRNIMYEIKRYLEVNLNVDMRKVLNTETDG